MMIKPAALALAAGLVLGLAGTSLANDLLATEQFAGTIVAFQPQRAYANMTLRVTGPNEYQASLSYPGGAPAIDLARFGNVYDGVYNYHLTGTTGETILGSGRNDGRAPAATSPYQLKDVSKGGSFRVQGGAIVSRTLTEPKRTR
jgi:hypothetical protein